MTLALPLKLQGDEIFDANGASIALVRGLMPDYRERGAEIVAAVNSNADLLEAAKMAIGTISRHSMPVWTYNALQAAIKAEEAW